jgi:hypothetical protein
MAASLDDARGKIVWAHRHLVRLEALIQDFQQGEPYSVHEEADPNGTHRILVAEANPAPPDIPYVLGDIIHALHSALDYIVCSLVENVGRPVSKTHAFPIFADPSLYNSRAPQMLRHVPYEAIGLIESLQPYNGAEGFALGRLYELSVAEKHRALLVTTALPEPDYVGHNRTGEEPSGIEFRLSPTQDKAYILLPADEPDEYFEPHFRAEVRLVEQGRSAWEVDGVARMIYNDVAHHIFPKVQWLRLLPLSTMDPLPYTF